MHPSWRNGSALFPLKHGDLTKRVQDLDIVDTVEDRRSNPPIRKAIWQYLTSKEGLQCKSSDIPLDKEGAKEIWENFSQLIYICLISC